MYFNVSAVVVLSIFILLSPVCVVAKDTLVVGLVSKYENSEYIQTVEEKAIKVAQKLSDLGIEQSKLLVVKTVDDMIQAIQNNQVDWITGSLFPALLYSEETDAKIFVQRYNNGVKKYRSVFFVRKDSAIRSLDKLERKRIALGDVFSTSTYFLPYYELFENNYTLVGYGQSDDQKLLGKKRVYYTNMKSVNAIVTSVLETKADIGVLSDSMYEKIKPEIKEQLTIIHKTPLFPVAVEVVRGNMESSIREALRSSITEFNAAKKFSLKSEPPKNENRFYDLVGEGRDGYVYLKNIVKHRTVPVPLEKGK